MLPVPRLHTKQIQKEDGVMKDEDFFKFPSTPHLATLDDVVVRGDKVFTESERRDFLTHELVVEEKVDGANLGLSFGPTGEIRAQNRGAYLTTPYAGQWKKLDGWLAMRCDTLFDHLSDRYILFGEWCYARHSVYYNLLPDWFLAFDIFDKREQRFLSIERRDAMVSTMALAKVPYLDKGHFTFSDLGRFLVRSKLADQPAEGIYLRCDRGDWLQERAKLVRASFIQSQEQHWSDAGIRPNAVIHDGV